MTPLGKNFTNPPNSLVQEENPTKDNQSDTFTSPLFDFFGEGIFSEVIETLFSILTIFED